MGFVSTIWGIVGTVVIEIVTFESLKDLSKGQLKLPPWSLAIFPFRGGPILRVSFGTSGGRLFCSNDRFCGPGFMDVGVGG